MKHDEIEPVDPLDWRQFVIAIRRLADNFNYGTDRSPFLGSGVEFVQSRRYQYGDPIRAIDWRVTARTGKVYVKEYETPKQMPCYLLFDTSASMLVSSQPRSKYTTGLQIAGGLALACLDRVSPVGLITTGTEEYRVEPTLSKDRVLRWLHDLRRHRTDNATVIGKRLSYLCAQLGSRALIIVISDLHSEDAVVALKRAAQQHDVVAVQMRDPAELDLAGAGFVRVREPETGRSFVTHGRRSWKDQEEVEQLLKRRGIDHIVVDTDKPFSHHMRWFFKARGGLGKGAR